MSYPVSYRPPLFTARMGRMDPERALLVQGGDPGPAETPHGLYVAPEGWAGLWRMRHRRDVVSIYRGARAWERCVCPAVPRDVGTGGCTDRASQEDRLCDACRDWCFMIDGATGARVQMVDYYGACTWS